jgi:hypothetical protein
MNMNPFSFSSLSFFVLILTSGAVQAESGIRSLSTAQRVHETAPFVQSLAGDWGFQLDPGDKGIAGQWFNSAFTEKVRLPGTTDEMHKGNPETNHGNINQLTRRFKYYGAAWYQREITIPESWRGKRIRLCFERSKVSQAWLNDLDLGTRDSLTTPHCYELPPETAPGTYRLTLRVDNKNLPPVGHCHQISEDTQTNWNGILGKIELLARDPVWIEQADAYPDLNRKAFTLKIKIGNASDQPADGTLTLAAAGTGSARKQAPSTVTVPFKAAPGGETVEALLPLGPDALTWDEFSPALYQLTITLAAKTGAGTAADRCSRQAGLRSFTAQGTQFNINGKTVFLRGKHDACVFPLTGYAPMEKAGWLKVMRTAQSYGINHYRFHSWCPPEAAFEAADELGIYLQVELPNWRNFEENGDSAHFDYQLAEGKRILDAYGNHPSFVMLTLGNELWGSRKLMARLVDAFRKHDPRHLYAQGTNNFFSRPQLPPGDDFWVTARTSENDPKTIVRGSFAHVDRTLGRIQTGPADTLHDLAGTIRCYRVPIIGQETGQYQFFPDLTEIPKYTGVLAPYNFEVIRKRLDQKGLLDQAPELFNASARFSALCYRADNELSLRTPGLAGFQMLDLQDFPGQGTALVGILNAFMESKGAITPEEWRQSCDRIVMLARLPSYAWTAGDTFNASIEVANYGPATIPNAVGQWSISDLAGKKILQGSFPMKEIKQGGTTSLGDIRVVLANCPAPARLNLEIRLPSTGTVNQYPLWLYPKTLPETSVKQVKRLDPATLAAVRNGAAVLVTPDAETVQDVSVPGFFTPDYWSCIMFRNPPGTLGLMMDPRHPALALFPTESHGNWQWFDITMNSRPVILDELPPGTRPIVQVIDNFDRCHRLALVSEFTLGKGKLLLASCDFDKLKDQPAAKQLLASLKSYLASPRFQPQQELPPSLLNALTRINAAAGKKITLAPEADEVLNPQLAYQNKPANTHAKEPHTWQVDLETPATVNRINILWLDDGAYSFRVEGSTDGRQWQPLCNPAQGKRKESRTELSIKPQTIRFLRLTFKERPAAKWPCMKDVLIYTAN